VNIVSLLVLHFSDLSHRENSKAGISNKMTHEKLGEGTE